jgi:chlorobactene glucosyltransferase
VSRLWGWRSAAAFTFLALPLAIRAERAYRALPTMRTCAADRPLPSLSIIVPARNEAENLDHLLPSLGALRYPGRHEVIVVDDNSTDATAAVAAKWGARVLQLNGLPDGWHGKPHACHRGALAAGGDWLLFTDADTIHTLDGPARAVACAITHRLDGLSLFLGQECRDLGQRVALSTAFAGLFAALPRRTTLLNGQYILLRRDVYERSGGFSAVRNEMLEDVALGHHLHDQGYRVPVMHGYAAARVRMYRNTTQMWHGLTRLGSGSLRWTGPGALRAAAYITAVMSPLLALVGVTVRRLDPWWLPVTWAAASVSMVPWARRFGSPALAALSPAGALLVQIAAVWGLGSRLMGRGVCWKGRRVR